MRVVRRTGKRKGTNKNRVSYSSARRNLAESKSVYPIYAYKLLVCLFTYFSPRWSGMRSMNAVTVPVSDFKYTLSKAYTHIHTFALQNFRPRVLVTVFILYKNRFQRYNARNYTISHHPHLTIWILNYVDLLWVTEFFRKEKSFNIYLVFLFFAIYRDNK